MYKGTSASAGIGIGKAVIVEEAQLVITRQAVNNVEEEVQRFKGALDETIKATEKLAEDLATRVGEGSGNHAGTYDASGRPHADRRD